MNNENEVKKKGEKKRREGETEENETETLRRRCEDCDSVEAFEIFCQEGDLGSCGGLSCEDLLEKPEDLSDSDPL